MPELLTKPFILVILLTLALIEWRWARRTANRPYDVRASLGSFGVALGQFLLKPFGAFIITPIYFAAADVAPISLSISDWRVWVVGFFALEFAYYWFHRWSHLVNWLWATHAVHHSANELTLPAAVRLGWTGVISGGWLVYLPLVLVGFPPLMVGGLLAINLLYQYGLHTEAVRKLGPLEWVFNTPSHHRAHHASEGRWLDCNFGGFLIIFDRLFGTFVAEPDEGGLRYGLTEPIVSHNPVVIALHQWRVMARAWVRASTWQDRLTVLVGRPSDLHPVASLPPRLVPRHDTVPHAVTSDV
jgi:sterol desaturase/sphingolipid hydroxylase (fatty acid hydroxylase superfamily)